MVLFRGGSEHLEILAAGQCNDFGKPRVFSPENGAKTRATFSGHLFSERPILITILEPSSFGLYPQSFSA
jgi:hypothetical protein